jgi:acyl carrier protein
MRVAARRISCKWITQGSFSMPDEVAEKVIATLASVKRIPAEKISMETNLQDLGIDSLDVFTLLFELENAFKISIPDDDVRSIRTVSDIVDGVKKILAAAPPDASLGSATPAT